MEIEWHHNSETVAQIGTQGWGIPKRYDICSPGYRDADSFVLGPVAQGGAKPWARTQKAWLLFQPLH